MLAAAVALAAAASLVAAGDWLRGKATHYGPYPSFPGLSEAGYYPNDVGVGCSNGQPGGDPRWKAITAKGLIPNPLDNNTVWPVVATVAVSETIWGSDNKAKICFQKVQIRNAVNQSLHVEAYVVDFCPTNGCLWPRSELRYNVDIYGQRTFQALGGGLLDGTIDIEVIWPDGIAPNNSAQPRSSHLLHAASAALLILLCHLGRTLKMSCLNLAGVVQGEPDAAACVQHVAARLHETASAEEPLESVFIGSNGLESLPIESLRMHASLRILDASFNRLADLAPLADIPLRSLAILDLRGNRISRIPTTAGCFIDLRQLLLGSNLIRDIPSAFLGGLARLETLDVSANQISSLPQNLFLSCPRLKRLDASHNQLRTLPRSLESASGLVQLNLAHNRIAQVPVSIQALGALEILDLSFNHLASPQPALSHMNMLQTLILDGNRLESLSVEIGGLVSLRTLSLRRNFLRSLPRSLGKLTALENLYLFDSDRYEAHCFGRDAQPPQASPNSI
ncbi:hypothetical protein HK105_206339 [Polyrhizophydium stewartii]|uniref:Uncharacterized protein n=1 Tax=Polyrhizophydium stewartii TaxID=2732419 RepID=A0ABR4N3G5_9FUNG